jgi:hypothetical protein
MTQAHFKKRKVKFLIAAEFRKFILYNESYREIMQTDRKFYARHVEATL